MKATPTTLYVAADGTEFRTEDECLEYERIFDLALTLISRAEAWKFAQYQLDDPSHISESAKASWHYGRCEIQQLLDQIYGFDSKGRPVPRTTGDQP